MKIYASQQAGLFQMREMNPAMNQRQIVQGAGAQAARRGDTAVISPNGKSSGVLANLMNQKELIQMNKESLVKKALDEETGTASSGFQEQLEEYEEQLEELDKQIASEMAKQAESEEESGKIYQNPKKTNSGESIEDSAVKLTEMAVEMDKAQTSEQIRNRREGEKKVCESEIELGSEAAKRRLTELEEKEQLTAKVQPFLRGR